MQEIKSGDDIGRHKDAEWQKTTISGLNGNKLWDF
jgi:hypothetical protein